MSNPVLLSEPTGCICGQEEQPVKQVAANTIKVPADTAPIPASEARFMTIEPIPNRNPEVLPAFCGARDVLCSAITRSRGHQHIFMMRATQHQTGVHPEALADPVAREWCRGGHNEAG